MENILDTAGQKGTGKWTGIAALDEGVPLTLIGEAVFARCLSAMKPERVEAAKVFNRKIPAFTGDKAAFVENIRQALFASKIISYAQGYTLMRTAAKTYGWNLNYGGIALMWRGGCIIRSVFLGKIKEAYDKNPELTNLLLDPYFKETIEKLVPAWRQVAAAAVSYGIPAPAMTSALAYFDGYTTERLPANLLQAARLAPRPVLPHELDRPRRQHLRRHVQRLKPLCGRGRACRGPHKRYTRRRRASVVLGLDLEVGLRVVADRTLLGGLLALDDRAAVAALPAVRADAHPHLALLDVRGELAVALLVVLLDLGDLRKEERVGEALVHVRPLLVLARGGGEEVGRRVADALQRLEPELGVLLLVQRRLLEDGRDLLVAVLLRPRGEEAK